MVPVLATGSWPFGGLWVWGNSRDDAGSAFLFRIPMIMFLGALSWFFFNIGVPVFAPVALLPLVSFSRAHQQSATSMALKCVQEGQLLWIVISMCASACYEIGSAIGRAASDSTRVLMFAALLWHVLIIVAASVIVSFSSTDGGERAPASPDNVQFNRRLMWASALATAVVAITYSISHYSLS